MHKITVGGSNQPLALYKQEQRGDSFSIRRPSLSSAVLRVILAL